VVSAAGAPEPERLIGRQINGVRASWYVSGDGVRCLIHVWLDVSGLGLVRVHALNGTKLDLLAPHDPYDMPELGGTVEVVEGGPAPLAAIVGASIEAIRPLVAESGGFRTGFVVETQSGAVGIADIGDDLAIGAWPDPNRWAAAGIRTDM
jgi:hypothetical protein